MKARIGMLAIAASTVLFPAAADEPCGKVEVEYALTANLRLSHTPMGKGDGIYPIGPGTLVLRFEGNDVKVVSYKMHESITIHGRFAFWWATVKTEADNTASAPPCGSAAEATLDGKVIHWRSPVRKHSTNGTIDCDGPACGMFGAPPHGRSELHVGPGDAQFGTFYFSPDMNTFTMPSAPPMTTESPKQTSQLALSGREVKRTCISAPCVPR